MTNDPMDIVFASDANYFYGLRVALGSVLEHSTGLAGARIHILDGGMSKRQRRLLERQTARRASDVRLIFHPLSSAIFDGMHPLNGSTVAYARLLLDELLADVPQALYLDVDVYYGADLRALWEHDLAGAGVAAVADAYLRCLGRDGPWIAPGAGDADAPYFNSGVLKIDLDYWRRHAIGARALMLARTEPDKCRYHDQTVLNHLLKGAVSWLNDDHNFMLVAGNRVDACQESATHRNLHFCTSPKPWAQYSSRPSFRYWRAGYAALVSPWPGYQAHLRFWAMDFRVELMASRPVDLLCRLLLVTGLYRLLPGTNKARLSQRLSINRGRLPAGVSGIAPGGIGRRAGAVAGEVEH